jgi:hypothetical protein
VGKAYKQLIKDWQDVLPTQSGCLIVPINYDDASPLLEVNHDIPESKEKNSRSIGSLFKAAIIKDNEAR